MHPTVILISVFAIFIPALILPGPDFVAVVRSSMTRGTTAGLLTTIGVSIGLGIYATLGLLGLSAILMKFHWLAMVIRIAGGAYLIYLGIRLLLAKPTVVELSAETSTSNALLFGLFVNAHQSQGDRAVRQRVRDVGDRRNAGLADGADGRDSSWQARSSGTRSSACSCRRRR